MHHYILARARARVLVRSVRRSRGSERARANPHCYYRDLPPPPVVVTPPPPRDAPPPRAALSELEHLNPGFSKKDRIARQIVDAACADGSLRAGQPVVELTSGNTGTGLAIVCGVRGHPFVAVMSRGNSPERARMMRALGAEVMLVDISEGGDCYFLVVKSANPYTTHHLYRSCSSTSCRARRRARYLPRKTRRDATRTQAWTPGPVVHRARAAMEGEGEGGSGVVERAGAQPSRDADRSSTPPVARGASRPDTRGTTAPLRQVSGADLDEVERVAEAVVAARGAFRADQFHHRGREAFSLVSHETATRRLPRYASRAFSTRETAPGSPACGDEKKRPAARDDRCVTPRVLSGSLTITRAPLPTATAGARLVRRALPRDRARGARAGRGGRRRDRRLRRLRR